MLTYDSGLYVGEWVRERIPCVKSWIHPFVTCGVKIDDILLGGVVYDGFTGTDINMHVAIDSIQVVTRRSLRTVFTFPFVTLKCLRVTGLVPMSNLASQRICKKLGFVLEGCKRKAFEDDNELIFGMTKENCRWL